MNKEIVEKFEKYYVLDTNIILADALSIVRFSEKSNNLIILPETVLDEIDSKKSGFDEINFQAREFARILSDSKIINKQHIGESTIISIYINSGYNIRIDIISKKRYTSDFNNCALNIINDRKILEIAKDCELLYRNKKSKIEFISGDIMARTRAISIDLETSDELGDKNSKYDYEFHREITIDAELNIKNLDGKKITKLDSEYKENYYTYTINFKSGHTCYGFVLNGLFNLIDVEKDYTNLVVKPLSVEQKMFCSGLLENNYDIVVCDAKAGSGKTLLALSAALRLVDLKKYSKIIYIRNSIESTDKGEDVGYLPGLEEKFKIYNHPLYDTLDFIARQKSKGKKNVPSEQEITEAVDQMKKDYNISTMWVGEMRGRTISNAFIIVDEFQNISNKSSKLILSRIDKTCKVVAIGSNAQIDNLYINKYTNGLTKLLQASYKEHDEVKLFSCKLNKVYRGPITEFAEKIFS